MSKQHKNRHFCFSLRWRLVPYFSPTYNPVFPLILPLLGKQRALNPPCGERSRGPGKSSPPLPLGWTASLSWVSRGGWRLWRGSRGEYRVCEYSICQRISIAVISFWRLQILGPFLGTSSSSYPRKGILLLSRFEPDPPFQGSGVLSVCPYFRSEF